MHSDKRRERIEKQEELQAQQHVIAAASANVAQSGRKLAQIEADYRRALFAERNEVAAAVDRLAQERAKHAHREALLELRAPQAAIVKDLATHTIGTVVQPGTILLALQDAQLLSGGERFALAAGMQAQAEVLLGTRTVAEYLLSPLQKAFHEAARER